jgi:RNA polymerase sigma-70 factor (ECF subfamily)
MSDAALLIAIGRYDELALAEALRRHGGPVWAVAMRVTGSASAADDITQEVFVGLWNDPQRFDPARGSLRSYLLAVAHHRAVDVLRSEQARRAREERAARDLVERGAGVEEAAWGLVVAEQVRQALEQLPEREREAIELAYFGGHTYREVAALLEEPEGTVKTRIRTGLRRLRALLSSLPEAARLSSEESDDD